MIGRKINWKINRKKHRYVDRNIDIREWEREINREREWVCECVCVCVWERERERERVRKRYVIIKLRKKGKYSNFHSIWCLASRYMYVCMITNQYQEDFFAVPKSKTPVPNKNALLSCIQQEREVLIKFRKKGNYSNFRSIWCSVSR